MTGSKKLSTTYVPGDIVDYMGTAGRGYRFLIIKLCERANSRFEHWDVQLMQCIGEWPADVAPSDLYSSILHAFPFDATVTLVQGNPAP